MIQRPLSVSVIRNKSGLFPVSAGDVFTSFAVGNMEESGAIRMKTVRVFVASSLKDFKKERLELRELFSRIEQDLGIKIQWLCPETTHRFLRREGSQSVLNQYIRESDFVFLIVGEHMGKYTLEEFNVAWEQFEKTNKPDIRPYFLLSGEMSQDETVYEFQDRLRVDWHYYDDRMSSFAEVKEDMQSILMDWFAHPTHSAAVPYGQQGSNHSATVSRTEVGLQEATSVDEEETFYQEKLKNAEDSGGGELEENSGEVWKRNGFLRCLKALQEGPLFNYPEIELICHKGALMAEKRANPELTPREREDALEEFEKALEQSVDRLEQDRDNENTHEFNERLGALMELRKALWNDPPPTT